MVAIASETTGWRRGRRSPAALVWAWGPLVLFVLTGMALAGWPELTATVWRVWLSTWAPELSPRQLWTYVRVMRKLVHMLVYGVLAILLLRATNRTWGRTWPLLAIALAGVVGVLDELNQSRLPQRTAAAEDVFFDVAGATMAVAAWQVWRGR